jgi:transposase
LEETRICIVDSEGRIVVEKKVASQPASIAGALNSAGFTLKRVGLEAGPLSPWLYAGLCAAGFAAICIETRQVKAALKAMRNKTDRNDARGIAQIMRTGWFRMVHVKGTESQQVRRCDRPVRLVRGRQRAVDPVYAVVGVEGLGREGGQEGRRQTGARGRGL